MRKFLVPLLLASTLIPAAVSAQDGGRRGPRTDGERSEQRDSSSNDRPQRAERVQRIERAGGNEPVVRMERAERAGHNIQQVQSVEPVGRFAGPSATS